MNKLFKDYIIYYYDNNTEEIESIIIPNVMIIDEDYYGAYITFIYKADNNFSYENLGKADEITFNTEDIINYEIQY